jgi:hypothetical protein
VAPGTVAPEERFDVEVGLAGVPLPGVTGGRVRVPLPEKETELVFDIQLAAAGMEAPEGWLRVLRVPAQSPFAERVHIPLVARPLPDGEEARLSFLLIHYSCRGSSCGMASRKIATLRPGVVELGIGEVPSWTTGTEADAPVNLDPSNPSPDLTIRISKSEGNPATGKYEWTFVSPHPLALPAEPLEMDLGEDAATFAKKIITEVRQQSDGPLVATTMDGIGKTIRDKIPEALWLVLRQLWELVHEGMRRVPTVLILSAEAHVPWELAYIEHPTFDAALPPFLGAQFAIARWLLQGALLPPPVAVEVKEIAIVAGDYRSSNHLRELPEAIKEGESLTKALGAIRLTATKQDLANLLSAAVPKAGGAVGVEVIHFACHGEFDGSGIIYLDDDSVLTPIPFRGATIGPSHGPLLFLNACQVGQAGEMLGEYAGFAGNSLRNGFRGFVAPLWSVKDDIAREIALRFYVEAFGAGGSPGPKQVSSILQGIRGEYGKQGGGPPQPTYLAYVFYGHPALHLGRAS